MSDFQIVKPEPFTVEGVDGTIYELPRVKDMSADQLAEMGKVGKAKGERDQVLAVKGFILSLCPDLADEPLSDFGYTLLFQDLAKGSGITVGEF